jgi:hypothetical protein
MGFESETFGFSRALRSPGNDRKAIRTQRVVKVCVAASKWLADRQSDWAEAFQLSLRSSAAGQL